MYKNEYEMLPIKRIYYLGMTVPVLKISIILKTTIFTK
jgi:hypothetical protein